MLPAGACYQFFQPHLISDKLVVFISTVAHCLPVQGLIYEVRLKEEVAGKRRQEEEGKHTVAGRQVYSDLFEFHYITLESLARKFYASDLFI